MEWVYFSHLVESATNVSQPALIALTVAIASALSSADRELELIALMMLACQTPSSLQDALHNLVNA